MVHTDTAPLSRYGVAFWVLCGCAAPLAGNAADSVDPPPSAAVLESHPAPDMSASLLDFDIPSQPLDAALRQYAALSRQATLFRSEIVADRTSSAVRGIYSPEAALSLLLTGTGLVAEKVDTGPDAAFILKAGSAPVTASRSDSGDAGDTAYPALIQAGVWAALCADASARPGRYRSLLRFQVDAAGRVQRPRLLGSTGNSRRDAAVLATLRQVRLERAPPPDLPQPVTMLILPRDAHHPDAAPYCADDTGMSDDGAPLR